MSPPGRSQLTNGAEHISETFLTVFEQLCKPEELSVEPSTQGRRRMASPARNMTFNPKIRELANFSFEKEMEAGDGVFNWHTFRMPQIPGFKFFLRICRTKIKVLPSGQMQPDKLTKDGSNVDNISNYFSVQLCVEKGRRKSEEKMRSELSEVKLRGTLILTQTSASGIHTMAGTIFGPNEHEEHYKEISSGLIQYGTYKYNPKSTRPAFTGWFFGTEQPTFIDQYNNHMVVDANWTYTSEPDVYRDFYTLGEVPNLKMEVSIHHQ